MHSSKLLTFLRTFTPDERKAFAAFVQSPYFNSNKKVAKLYLYIRTTAPDFIAPKLERKKAFKHLFPKEVYREIKLHQLMSEMVKLVEKFWIQQGIEQQHFPQQLQLTRSYRQRNLEQYWQKNRRQLQTALSSQPDDIEAAEVYFYQYQLEADLHQSIEIAEQRTREPNLQSISDSLDRFYCINKLKYYCKALNYQRFKTISYEWTMITDILKEVEKGELLQIPAVAIYYQGVQTLLEKDDAVQHFEQLKSLLRLHAKRFSRAEIQNMFILARNYCIRQVNKGSRDFLKEIFELYKIEIAQEIILEEGKLSPTTYKNITTVALALEEFEWFEQFIHDYQWAVTPETFNFTLAQLRFEQKKYKTVIRLLQQAEYEEALLLLTAKALLLKTYFELSLQSTDNFEYEDKLDNYLVSFTVFLQRKKEALTKHYIYYVNFVKVVKAIVKAIHYGAEVDTAKLHQLEQKLNMTKQITEKPWLRDKLKELT